MTSSIIAGQDVSWKQGISTEHRQSWFQADRRQGRSWLLIGSLLCVGAARSTRTFELMCLLLLCDRVSCCANGTVFMVCFAVGDVSATLGMSENISSSKNIFSLKLRF